MGNYKHKVARKLEKTLKITEQVARIFCCLRKVNVFGFPSDIISLLVKCIFLARIIRYGKVLFITLEITLQIHIELILSQFPDYDVKFRHPNTHAPIMTFSKM